METSAAKTFGMFGEHPVVVKASARLKPKLSLKQKMAAKRGAAKRASGQKQRQAWGGT
jgi:hypothetical protein